LRNHEGTGQIAAQTTGIAVVCGGGDARGFGERQSCAEFGGAPARRQGGLPAVENAVATYDVFDEARNFAPASSQQTYALAGGIWRSHLRGRLE